ncbi:MAG: hypothetical protein KAH25_08820 [Bacteroidales bacterium]|nr:hypothetical protein [Bacteroidales bacterium]
MNYSIKIALLLLTMLLANSCKEHLNSNSETVLARVGDHYLDLNDISNSFSVNMSAADSLQMLNSLVNNWVRQALLLQYANASVPDSLKDFSKQLKEYENNLLIYEYKKRLVVHRLDTLVAPQQIKSYYDSHQNDFQLRENIVQFAYIKIPLQSEEVENARALIKNINDTSVNRTIAEEFCQAQAVDYFLITDQWVPFYELLKSVPIEVFNQEIYLKNNRFIEIKDHPYWYFVNLINFKIKEDVSPLAFEKDNIRNIILNQRKLKLLENLEDDIFEESAKTKMFEIY